MSIPNVTPKSNLAEPGTVDDVSPSPSRSRRASQVFRFLLRTKSSPNSGRPKTVDEESILEPSVQHISFKSEHSNNRHSAVSRVENPSLSHLGDNDCGKSDSALAGSYRLYHLPGRPRCRDVFDRERVVSTPQVPHNLRSVAHNTKSVLTAKAASRSESNLLISKSAPTLQRKLPPYDLYFAKDNTDSTRSRESQSLRAAATPLSVKTNVARTRKPQVGGWLIELRYAFRRVNCALGGHFANMVSRHAANKSGESDENIPPSKIRKAPGRTIRSKVNRKRNVVGTH